MHCAALNDTQECGTQMVHCVVPKDTQECGTWSAHHYMECAETDCCENKSVLRTNELMLELCCTKLVAYCATKLVHKCHYPSVHYSSYHIKCCVQCSVCSKEYIVPNKVQFILYTVLNTI